MRHNSHSRTALRAVGSAAAAAAVLVTAAACGGGSTVEGEVPETTTTTPTSTTPFAEERPEPVTSAVTPPPTSIPEPAPQPEPEPAPEPEAEGEPPPPPPPDPVTEDFRALLDQHEVRMPEGTDPVALAHESCGRFDAGQTMVDVTGWLGERTGFNPDRQGFFLGAAVGTFCAHNVPKLG